MAKAKPTVVSENMMMTKDQMGNLVNPKRSVPALKTPADKRVKTAQTPTNK